MPIKGLTITMLANVVAKKHTRRTENISPACRDDVVIEKTKKTRSYAVAKRPRDALCLSVVSFNSTKRRVESFIGSYVGYRFVTACS